MNSPRKILLIDNAANRKQRINILRERGYRVFPALRMEEARSRCTRGGYDLIVVNADGQQEQALGFCDEIRSQCPSQLLMMASADGAERDYAVSGDLVSFASAVDKALQDQSADMASAA